MKDFIMLDLIKIEQKEIGSEIQNTVDARELWKTLGLKREFSTWIKESLDMFSEGQDYQRFDVNVKSGILVRERADYSLTIDTAKHISMMSRTEKGKQVRNYFIQVEKKARELYKQSVVEAPREITTKAKIALQDCLDVADILGVPKHIAQVEAIQHVQQLTEIDYSSLLLSAPAQNNIKKEEMMLEVSDIGKIIGMTGTKVNRLLQEKGLQYRKNKSWEPTEIGKSISMINFWCKKNKKGYNYKWNVEKVKEIIA